MRSLQLILFLLPAFAFGQFNGPWGQGAPPGHGRPGVGKPQQRPAPFSRPIPNYGKPVLPSNSQIISDDPIPANPNLDNSYESQQLPSKLPLLAPNGVVEIYNRVVDDLIEKLEVSFKKREIDPMNVVIRPTPSTPVRVPGHLQKRPFRRPGAPLYRSNAPAPPVRMKNARSNPLPVQTDDESPAPQVDEKPSFRGVGKISKGPLGEEKVEVSTEASPVTAVLVTSEAAVENTSPTPKVPVVVVVNDKSVESSEEQHLFRSRSDEYFPEDEEADEVDETSSKGNTKSRTTLPEKKTKKEQKKEESEEDEDDVKAVEEGKKDVDTLLQRYQNKNVNAVKEKGKNKYTTGGSKKKEDDHGTKNKRPEVSKKKDEEDEVQDEDEDDEENQEDLDDVGGQHGGNGFYQGGGGPMQQKPNAQLSGLSKIKRASDVVVNVDARSAIITARLLVGPLHININDSIEPMERNVRATVPELEAELILMERHGVVFLQRFTLDRAYGQDVEISMPKAKSDLKKKKKPVIQGPPGMMPPTGMDPNHPQAQQRFQTKMAAHISMEVVKLLRSGNLRVNIMRTAQSSMSKLKLPIKTNKNSKKKGKKSESKKNNN